MFYGFEFTDGAHTTTGRGRIHTAGTLYGFRTRAERDAWADADDARALNTGIFPFRLAVRARGMVAVGWRGESGPDGEVKLWGWRTSHAVDVEGVPVHAAVYGCDV